MALLDHEYVDQFTVPHPRDGVFDFFAEATNLEAITPPELAFRIVTPLPIVMQRGTLIEYDLRLHGAPVRWLTLISRWNPPEMFADEQLRGPYTRWIHTHTFTPTADGEGTIIADRIDYRLPYGILGLPALPLVKHQLHRVFTWRQSRVRELLGIGRSAYA